MREVVIVGMARTPFGNFLGTLCSLPAPKLGAIAIQAALKRAGVPADQVSEVIMGNVLQAGVGQAPARQAAIYAGIPKSVPALTVNKVCGSGMKAIMLAAQSIMLGDSEVVVAGGMESMSNAPYIVQNARNGFRMGNQSLIDAMIYDGLWDPYSSQHMGTCGEACAKEYKFTREMQDAYAIDSYKKAQAAQKAGKFNAEITSVEIQGRKGDTVLVESDEGPMKAQFDKIPMLKPAFDKAGTVTAANASPVNDGAAVVVLMSADKAKALGIKPLAKIVSYGTHAQEPLWFTTAPATAMRSALKKANWEMGSVDVFEVNEAFAVVSMAAQKDLGIPAEKMNVWGGAIAIGHPIGASGARLTMTMIAQLKDMGKKRGLAGICIGGGEATAICLELIA
jgi:acetyl-CoA C-acetyltransferase